MKEPTNKREQELRDHQEKLAAARTPHEIARHMSNVGMTYAHLGDLPRAADLMQQALALYEKLDDEFGIAHTLNRLSGPLMDSGRRAEARGQLMRALELARCRGFRSAEATALNNLGLLDEDDEDLESAARNFRASLVILAETQEEDHRASTFSNLGSIEMELGNRAAAKECFEQSIEINKKLGRDEGLAVALNNLATLIEDDGDATAALVLYRRALALQESIGDSIHIGNIAANIGKVLAKRGEHDEALLYRKRALEAFEVLRDPKRICDQLFAMADVHFINDDTPAMRDALERALVVAEASGDAQLEVTALIERAYNEAYGDHDRESLTFADEALRRQRLIDDDSMLGATLDNVGLVHSWAGQPEKAMELLELSLAVTIRCNDKRGEEIVRRNIDAVSREVHAKRNVQ